MNNKINVKIQVVTGYELRECPYCGEAPELKSYRSEGKPLYSVGCLNGDCEVMPSTLLHETPEEAANVWNGKRKTNDAD